MYGINYSYDLDYGAAERFKRYYCHMHSNTADGNVRDSEIWLSWAQLDNNQAFSIVEKDGEKSKIRERQIKIYTWYTGVIIGQVKQYFNIVLIV